VGKTLSNVFHCDIAEIRFVGKLMIIRTFFINLWIEFYLGLYNTINLRPLTLRIMLRYRAYLQNGDRIVAIDSVTSLHPMYFNVGSKADVS